MSDGKPIPCRECNYYGNGRCEAYNTIVHNADLMFVMCPASDRIQSPLPEVAPLSFVVGLGEKVAAEEERSSPKTAKPKRKKKKKPASVG